MQYAILGKTSYKVSRLGFGAMRLPMKGDKVDRDKAVPMIHRAFETGVNYIDTAVGYCNHDSQRAVGEALEGWREHIIVSTKNPYYNKHDDRPWWKNLEDSLERLDIETIDIYNFHGLRWQTFVDHVQGPDSQLAWMRKAKAQGLIRHIGFSFHDSAENLVQLARTGEFESVTLQYNLLDRSLEKALPTVKKLGLGIVVMGPVGGGRLGSPSPAIRKLLSGAKSVPEIALRFVLANPHVTIALSGMSEMSQVLENLRVASRPTALSRPEKIRVLVTLRRYKKLADLYCTGCDYCMPCPAGVEIPRNFSALNTARVYGLPDHARQQYRRTQGKASLCLACRKCLEKCPQHIDIIAQLRETVRTLDDTYGKLIVAVKPTSVERLTRRKRGYDLDLACRMECHNLSDQLVRPKLTFAPGERIGVAESGKIGQLQPFGRRAVKLAIEARGLKDGEPLRLGPTLGGGGERLLFAHDPLPVAIARKGAPGRVPLVSGEHVAGPVQPSAAARALHSIAAQFAWSTKALTVQLDVRGAFRRPVTDRRGIRESDNLWLNLFLDDLLGMKRPKDAPKHFLLGFGFPAKGSAMTVAVHRPRVPAEQVRTIHAEVKGRGQKRRVLIRVPWKLLQVTAPKPPARLGANFGLTCWPATGTSAWTLSWTPAGRGFVLLTG
ncbi:MAG TPA: aldo/keto reductase [Planctomycetota bacterium]|nr:aldo/keto reductase [Planctomycetota bacterium]